jgi:hypothetical protein
MKIPAKTTPHPQFLTAISAIDAQAYCNFTLFEPTVRNSDTTATLTIRTESPPNADRSEGRSPSWTEANYPTAIWDLTHKGSSLRLKMFLYDWAVPVADQPSLWNSEARPHRLAESTHPFPVWKGTDQLHRMAYTTRLDSTRIEISTSAEWNDNDIIALIEGLKPSDLAARRGLLEASFAERSYWARHGIQYPKVPDSLWNLQEARSRSAKNWHTVDRQSRELAHLRRCPIFRD